MKNRYNEQTIRKLVEEIYTIVEEDLIDNIYDEISNNIEEKNNKFQEKKERVSKLYDLVPYTAVKDLIMKELPFIVRTFSHIEICGKFMTEYNTIVYSYIYKNRHSRKFAFELNQYDLEKIVKEYNILE